MAGNQRSSKVIVAIGILKLVKGVLLVVAGVVALRLVSGGPVDTIARWVEQVRVDPDNRWIHKATARLARLSPKTLEALAIGTLVYAAIFITEGIGLILRRTWAEWLTLIVTASFIPLEVIEIARHATIPRVATLVVNIAIVFYLAQRRRHQRSKRRSSSRLSRA